MSPEEGVELVLGKGMHFFAFKGSFTVPGNAANTTWKLMDRYQIPSVSLADGPAGLRILEESVQYRSGKVKPLKNAISIFDYLPAGLSKVLLGKKELGTVLYGGIRRRGLDRDVRVRCHLLAGAGHEHPP